MEDKEQIRAILETAVHNGIMIKKRTWVDKSTQSMVYYFPWSETAKKKEPKEGQVMPKETP